MPKKLYVYSTLSSDVLYQNHASGGADLPQVTGEVMIKGGAGVANDRLDTPRGVATEITEAQAEILRATEVFKKHNTNGFVFISDENTSVEKAVASMEGRDKSAPLVSQDLPEDSQPMGGEDDKPKAKRK